MTEELRIAVYVSGHGFGHAAQVAPVLNALKWRTLIRSSVPRWFFAERLCIDDWELHEGAVDVGCLQTDPVVVDVEKTFAAHEEFHSNWEERVADEVSLLQEWKPHIVLSSQSYLAVAAARRAGIVSVLLFGFLFSVNKPT